jgi:hypothetical protein
MHSAALSKPGRLHGGLQRALQGAAASALACNDGASAVAAGLEGRGEVVHPGSLLCTC